MMLNLQNVESASVMVRPLVVDWFVVHFVGWLVGELIHYLFFLIVVLSSKMSYSIFFIDCSQFCCLVGFINYLIVIFFNCVVNDNVLL